MQNQLKLHVMQKQLKIHGYVRTAENACRSIERYSRAHVIAEGICYGLSPELLVRPVARIRAALVFYVIIS